MTVTGLQVRDVARSHDSRFRYDTGQSRCTGADGYVDCSGSVVLTLNQLGIWGVPTVSATQATWCRDNGTDHMALDEALHTAGCLLFKGANYGYDGWGNGGHVAITAGDGNNVIEARGHSYPATFEYSALGRDWSNAARIPGIDYANHPPKPVRVPKLRRIQHFLRPEQRIPPGSNNIMRGDDILDTQTKLLGWAFITRSNAMLPGAHDGGYGHSTAQAVIAFQKAAGLTVDAIVGPATWASLYRI